MEDTISIHTRKEGLYTIITVGVSCMYAGMTLYKGTSIEKAKQAINRYYDKEIEYINLQRNDNIKKLIKSYKEVM